VPTDNAGNAFTYVEFAPIPLLGKGAPPLLKMIIQQLNPPASPTHQKWCVTLWNSQAASACESNQQAAEDINNIDHSSRIHVRSGNTDNPESRFTQGFNPPII
jgi:hypothetical protein